MRVLVALLLALLTLVAAVTLFWPREPEGSTPLDERESAPDAAVRSEGDVRSRNPGRGRLVHGSVSTPEESTSPEESARTTVRGEELTERVDRGGGVSPGVAARSLEATDDYVSLETRRELDRLESSLRRRLLELSLHDDVDPAEWQRLHEEHDAAVAALLTDEERFEHEVRHSGAALSLRSELDGLDVSEEEIRELYRAQTAFDSEQATLSPSPQGAAAREASRRALDAAFRSVLGPQRHEEYRLLRELRRSPLAAIAEEEHLERPVVIEALRVTTQALETAQRLRAEPTIDDESRQGELDTLRARTERALEETLGAHAARRYIEREPRLRALNGSATATPPQR